MKLNYAPTLHIPPIVIPMPGSSETPVAPRVLLPKQSPSLGLPAKFLAPLPFSGTTDLQETLATLPHQRRVDRTCLFCRLGSSATFMKDMIATEQKEFVHLALAKPNTKYQELQRRKIGYFIINATTQEKRIQGSWRFFI